MRASSFMTPVEPRHVDGVIAEVGQPQVAEQDAAVGVRVGPHPPLALGASACSSGMRPARLVEELLGLVAAHPASRAASGARDARSARTAAPDARRYVPSTCRPSTTFGPVQPLGVFRTIIGHRGRSIDAPFPRIRLDAADVGDHPVERLGHELVHRAGLVPLDEVRGVAVAAQQVVRAPPARCGPGRSGWRSCSRSSGGSAGRRRCAG